MTEFERGFAAARHQAANLIGHLIVDEMQGSDTPEILAQYCFTALINMTDNGTRPHD